MARLPGPGAYSPEAEWRSPGGRFPPVHAEPQWRTVTHPNGLVCRIIDDHACEADAPGSPPFSGARSEPAAVPRFRRREEDLTPRTMERRAHDRLRELAHESPSPPRGRRNRRVAHLEAYMEQQRARAVRGGAAAQHERVPFARDLGPALAKATSDESMPLKERGAEWTGVRREPPRRRSRQKSPPRRAFR